MAYRKIIIAVDCNNDQEQQIVQNIAQEISGTFKLSAKDLIAFYPFVKQNKAILYSAVKTVAKEGKKGVLKLIPMLMKNL
jgi:hypothetical protein